MSRLSDLLEEFEVSKVKYDEFLTMAYVQMRGDTTRKATEEEVRLTARNSLRAAGFRDPEIIRMAIKVLMADTEE